MTTVPLYPKVLTSLQYLEFDFSVQHDCPSAGCSTTGKRARRQERIVCDDVLDDAIDHRDTELWVINTHSLHNGHLLRLRVRPELIALVRTIPADERQKRHRDLASGLRVGQDKRQKNNADKRAAKKVSTATNSKIKKDAAMTKPEPNAVEELMDVDEEGAGTLVP